MHSDSSTSKKHIVGPTTKAIYDILRAASPARDNISDLLKESCQNLKSDIKIIPAEALIFAYQQSIERFQEISCFITSTRKLQLLKTLKKKEAKLGCTEGSLTKWCDEMNRGLDSLADIAGPAIVELWGINNEYISEKDILDEPQKVADDLAGATTCTLIYISDLQSILQDIVRNPEDVKALYKFQPANVKQIHDSLSNLLEKNREALERLPDNIRKRELEEGPELTLYSESAELSQQQLRDVLRFRDTPFSSSP